MTKKMPEDVLNAVKMGQSAARVLREPAWERVYTEKMDMLFQGFLSVDPSDAELMRNVVLSGKAFREIKEQFENMAYMAANMEEEKTDD